MVTTRRTNTAANAEPAPARTTRAARKAAASQPASGEAEVAVTTTTTRRLRSAQAASPLKSLEATKRTTKPKRKRGTSRASASPEPESAKEEDQGLFFTSDIASFGIRADPPPPPPPMRPENIFGNEAAKALLHKIESAAQEPLETPPDEHHEAEVQSLPQEPEQQVAQGESSQSPADATPTRPISTPSGFFTRSFTAIVSKLGFNPTPTAPSPATPSTSRAPPPDTFTEILSSPPTPIGERKPRPRKKRSSPMLRLLTKGVDASELSMAEVWAKHAIPTLMNFTNSEAKRRRLETPVLVQELEHLPASKPWESGFGDPLGDLDDEDVAPVWAVFLDMLAKEEQPKKKRSKSSHGGTMDVDLTQSLDEMSAAGIAELKKGSPQRVVHNSHGNSASMFDLEPRRSVEPSPMFGSSAPQHEGGNIFDEYQGHDTAVELHTNDREHLHEATKKVTDKVTEKVGNHDPSQGSFGLDYDSDEDSSILSETSDSDAGTPLWTQPPPPAPVPAHAPLPGGSAAETSSAQQPVDELARQRQKLMKHTPAKPSRLREAFVPSPSVRSDAGNESLFIATPLAASDTFDDMPDAEELDLTPEMWAEVDAIRNSEAYLAADASVTWPDAILTYDSDEEALSPN